MRCLCRCDTPAEALVTFEGFLLMLIFPPLAILWNEGCRGHPHMWKTFFINLLLTVLGWIPGVIHAFWILFMVDDKTYRDYEQFGSGSCTII